MSNPRYRWLFGLIVLLFVYASTVISGGSSSIEEAASVSGSFQPEKQQPLDWSRIENQLRNQCDESLSLSGIEKCEVFSEILSLDEKGLFLEMVSQHRKRPLVSIAGFLGVQKRYPDDAPMIALGLLSTAGSPASPLYGSLYQELTKQKNRDVVDRVLDYLSARPAIQRTNVSMILLALDCDSTHAWYHNPNRTACSTSFEAAVFDRIDGECLNEERPRSDLMQNRLRQYAKVPGYPRLIYVTHAATSEEGFARVLASVLEDEDLKDMPDIALVCHRHKDYIKKSIDISALKITAERKTIIEKALERRP